MKFKILQTGSSGNAYIANIGDVNILIDCGKGCAKYVYSYLNANNLTLNHSLLSHSHSDHAGEFAKFQHISPEFSGDIFQENGLFIARFLVKHDVLNYGYLIKKGKDAIVFAVDFSEISNINLTKIRKELITSKRVILAIELSYNVFIFHKMKKEVLNMQPTANDYIHRMSKLKGLSRHCSDEYFTKILSYFLVNQTFEYEIITLHRSGEGLSASPTLAGWNNPNVAKMYFANIGLKRLFRNIQIGMAGSEVII